MIQFEYDPKKSQINNEKHGIDFDKAQELWTDTDRIEIESIQQLDELRALVIGVIEGKIWTAITTIRNRKVRIISVRRAKKKKECYMKTISAKEIDKKFDAGEDVLEYFDTENIRKPGLEQRRVNVDFPAWMIEHLDYEAKRLGVARQALIKFWIAERLKSKRR